VNQLSEFDYLPEDLPYQEPRGQVPLAMILPPTGFGVAISDFVAPANNK